MTWRWETLLLFEFLQLFLAELFHRGLAVRARLFLEDMLGQLKAMNHMIHAGRAFFRSAGDTLHDQVGKRQRNARIEIERRIYAVVDKKTIVALIDGVKRGNISAGERPVNGCTQIENVRLVADGLALYLLRGNVVRRALDALFDGADLAALAEVDDFYFPRVAAENVVGLDVAMHIAKRVHRLQALCHLDERIDGFEHCLGRANVERFAVDQFHHQECLGDFHQHRLVDFQIISAAKIGMSELPTDGEFLLHLLDEANVLWVRPNDVLQRVHLLGHGIAHGINNAAGALSETFQNIILEQFFSHENTEHGQNPGLKTWPSKRILPASASLPEATTGLRIVLSPPYPIEHRHVKTPSYLHSVHPLCSQKPRTTRIVINTLDGN